MYVSHRGGKLATDLWDIRNHVPSGPLRLFDMSDEKLQSMISMRWSPTELDELRRQAADQHVSVSAIIRQAVLGSVGRAATDSPQPHTLGTVNSSAVSTFSSQQSTTRLDYPTPYFPAPQQVHNLPG